MVIEADGVAACTDVACAVAEQDNNRINARMREIVFFFINQRDIFQHVPITSRKPVKPDSKGVPGFFAFWGSSRILANPGAS